MEGKRSDRAVHQGLRDWIVFGVITCRASATVELFGADQVKLSTSRASTTDARSLTKSVLRACSFEEPLLGGGAAIHKALGDVLKG